MWSVDTILRGPIYPTEGPVAGLAPGDWHHMDILKRVNINILGAKGVEDFSGEDSDLHDLKDKWARKAANEQRRLYYMLKAALVFSGHEHPQAEACQFVASLIDMVDRDQDEEADLVRLRFTQHKVNFGRKERGRSLRERSLQVR